MTDRPATASGNRAVACLVHVAPNATDKLGEARWLMAKWQGYKARGEGPVRMAASAWNGILGVRFVAAEARALRSAMSFLLTELRGYALPRVWSL